MRIALPPLRRNGMMICNYRDICHFPDHRILSFVLLLKYTVAIGLMHHIVEESRKAIFYIRQINYSALSTDCRLRKYDILNYRRLYFKPKCKANAKTVRGCADHRVGRASQSWTSPIISAWWPTAQYSFTNFSFDAVRYVW